MKNFLSRLFNLQPVIPECPSCAVYKQWLSQARIEHENALAIILEENRVLRDKLDASYKRVHEDKESERQERQALEETVLRYTRIKAPPEGRATQIQPKISAEGQQQLRVRPGTAWSSIRSELEKEARARAQRFQVKEDAEIKAGRMAPESDADIRNLKETALQGDKPGG